MAKTQISRQRKYQMEHRRRGLCVTCSAKAKVGLRCLKCAVKVREYQRRKKGSKRRNNSLSYRMETKLKR